MAITTVTGSSKYISGQQRSHSFPTDMANALHPNFRAGPVLNFGLSLTVAAAAVTANSLVLHAIRRAKSLDQPGAHLILVLTVSDLGNALSFLLNNIVRVGGWLRLESVCLQLNFLFTCAALCAIVVNNFDCHRAIMNPISYQVEQSRRRDLVGWAVSVFMTTALCVFPVAFPSDKQLPGPFVCLPQFFRVFLLILVVLSFVSILGLYMRIFHELRWQQVRVGGVQAHARGIARGRLSRRFFRKLGLVSGTFLLTWLPLWTLFLLIEIRRPSSWTESQHAEVVLQFVFLLSQTNSVINPFLYARSPLVKNAFMTNRLQQNFFRLVCCFSTVEDPTFLRPNIIHRKKVNECHPNMHNVDNSQTSNGDFPCVVSVIHVHQALPADIHVLSMSSVSAEHIQRISVSCS